MIASLLVLAPLSIAALWFYWRSAPTTRRRGTLLAYNIAVVLIVAGLTASLVLHVRASLGTGPDRAWWPVLAALASLALVPPLLAVAALFRNRVLFRGGASQS